MTSFIPVRIVGIICNLTTAGCQEAANRTYRVCVLQSTCIVSLQAYHYFYFISFLDLTLLK